MRTCSGCAAAIAILQLGCTDVRDDPPQATVTAAESTGASIDSTMPGTTADSSGTSDGAKFDVAPHGDAIDVPTDLCHVAGEMDAVGECEDEAPPESFAPAVQWTFGAGEQSWVTPLVANFTDDDGDGEINLCDVPDVVLV